MERIWSSLGASLKALGASLGALRKEVCWEHFSPPEMATARKTSPLKRASAETCPSKEREARTVRNPEDIRRWDYESIRVREYERRRSTRYETMILWDYETMKLWDYVNGMMSGAGLRPANDGVREYNMMRRWDFETKILGDHTTRKRWDYEIMSLRDNETIRLWEHETMKRWGYDILRLRSLYWCSWSVFGVLLEPLWQLLGSEDRMRLEDYESIRRWNDESMTVSDDESTRVRD